MSAALAILDSNGTLFSTVVLRESPFTRKLHSLEEPNPLQVFWKTAIVRSLPPAPRAAGADGGFPKAGGGHYRNPATAALSLIGSSNRELPLEKNL
jgi:hypothetical protein